MMYKVFVYGTLKSGQPNYKLLQSAKNGVAKFLGVGRLQKKYPLVVASDYFIPFLLDAVGIGKNVLGEIYEVDKSMLEALDGLEGYPHFYTRREEEVKLEGSESCKCWVYLLYAFKPELLSLNYLENWDYHALGCQYVARPDRDPARPPISMVKQHTVYKVFVYGTLKRGGPNHYLLQDSEAGLAKFICTGQTEAIFPLVIASKFNIPYLLDVPGSGKNINGEIFEVDDKMLEHLDILEEYPRLYTRREENIVVCESSENRRAEKCWVYLLHSFKPELLDLPHLSNWTQNNELNLPYILRSEREGPKSAYSHVKDL